MSASVVNKQDELIEAVALALRWFKYFARTARESGGYVFGVASSEEVRASLEAALKEEVSEGKLK